MMSNPLPTPDEEKIGPEAHGRSGIGRKVAISAGYMILARLSSRALGIVSSIVLARLLTPADFGVVGLAMMVLGTVDMLTESSIGLALIRITAPEARHYDTAWTLTVLRGLIVAVLMIATAGLQAQLFGDERIAAVIWVLAGIYVLRSLPSIRMLDFQRNLEFGRLYGPGIIGRLIAFIVSMTVSVVYRNYWALVLGNLAGAIYALVNSYHLAPYRPRITFANWREFFHFTRWLGLNNVFTMMDNQIPTFVIGTHDGVVAVGRYQIASQIAALPASEIAAPIRQPAYSGLSRLRDNIVALREQFIGQLALIVVIIAPLSLGLWVSAPWAVRVILGGQWTEAIPLLELCAIWTLLDALAHHVQMIFVVVARQRFYVIMNGSLILFRTGAVLLLGYYGGVVWIAGGIAATAGISLLVSLWFGLPLISATWRDFVEPIWRALVAVAVMSSGVLVFRASFPVSSDLRIAALHLCAAIALGGALYVAALAGLWAMSGRPAGPERQVLNELVDLARRWMPRTVAHRALAEARAPSTDDAPRRKEKP